DRHRRHRSPVSAGHLDQARLRVRLGDHQEKRCRQRDRERDGHVAQPIAARRTATVTPPAEAGGTIIPVTHDYPPVLTPRPDDGPVLYRSAAAMAFSPFSTGTV